MKLTYQTYIKFRNEINMSLNELVKWSKNELSFLASLNREPIKRIIHLLRTPKNKWGLEEHKEAKKVISYLKRAKKIKGNNYPPKKYNSNYTYNEIALKNWGYDIKK